MTWVVASFHGLISPFCQIRSGYCCAMTVLGLGTAHDNGSASAPLIRRAQPQAAGLRHQREAGARAGAAGVARPRDHGDGLRIAVAVVVAVAGGERSRF